MFLRIHQVEKDKSMKSGIDLLYRASDGKEHWIDTIHIDQLADMGLSDLARSKLKVGGEVSVKLVEE